VSSGYPPPQPPTAAELEQIRLLGRILSAVQLTAALLMVGVVVALVALTL